MCLDSPAPVFNCGPCPHCNSFKTERNGYCATYNADQRKAERQALKDASKVKKPIKKVSTKRAAKNREYLKLRKEYLELYPVCEVVECHNRSIEIHHVCGKENDKLIDTNHFLAVCRDCHTWITEDSAKAIALGYSILRNVTTP
jgi:hypothetical protein